VTAHQAFHGVAPVCRTLGVSPSGFYAWRKRPLSPRARTDVELSAEIQAIHCESRGTYGAPRIHAELAARGVRLGRKRVARLMRHAGLQGVSRRKQFHTTVRDDTALTPLSSSALAAAAVSIGSSCDRRASGSSGVRPAAR